MPTVAPKTAGNGTLIVKSNYLVNAEYNLSPVEMKIIYLMAMQVKKGDEDFKTYRMRIRDFQEVVGVDSDALYVRMEEIVRRLMKRIIRVRHENGDLDQFPFLARASHKNKKGIIELKFAPDLKPHLLDLKERFTSFYDYNVLALQSAHSMRIYELLKQYEFIGHRVERVERIKRVLGIENKYRSYNYFKKRVIIQAQKDLKAHCDIEFDFEEIKEGRKVEKIRFLITRKKRIRESLRDSRADHLGDLNAMEPELINFGLSPQQAKYYAQLFDHETLVEYLEYVAEKVKAGKVKHAGAYLKKLLDEEALNKPKAQQDIERQREKKRQQELEQKRQAERERQLLTKFEEEYEAFREQQISKLMEQAAENDWKEFEAYASKNPLVKARVMKSGKIDRKQKDTQFWFRIYLADARLPDRNEDFIRWIAQVKGYQVQERDGCYRITGKQNSLF